MPRSALSLGSDLGKYTDGSAQPRRWVMLAPPAPPVICIAAVALLLPMPRQAIPIGCSSLPIADTQRFGRQIDAANLKRKYLAAAQSHGQDQHCAQGARVARLGLGKCNSARVLGDDYLAGGVRFPHCTALGAAHMCSLT